MLLNYLRIAYRNLLKNKAFSMINIFGLGVGMTAFLFIIHYVRFEKSYENFNVNADNVYRVTLEIYNGSEYVMTDCETHSPLGPMLKEKMPEVRDFARMYSKDGLEEIRIDDQKFLENNIYFADPAAIEIFSLDVLKGDRKTALDVPYSAVITASVAKKYFGDKDPVGQTIQVRKDLYKVTALIADSPANTHLKTSILLSHKTLTQENKWYSEETWNYNNEFTYLLMVPGTDLAAFNDKLKILSLELKDKIDFSRFVAEPIKDIHLYSNKSFEPEVNGSVKIVYFLLTIAMFIIVIAWVNYVNLSTARAMDRAREVGIRKVLGSMKTQLVVQFLSESVIINLLSASLAFALFQTFLPVFRDIIGQTLTVNFIQDAGFWYLFIGLIVIGSILAGVYPAFVLSSFQPATVLKGKFQSSSHGQSLRKGLVVFQFGATVVLIVCLGAVYMQIDFLRKVDLGMNIDQTLIVRSPRVSAVDSIYKSSFQTLKTELLQNPEIQSIGQSDAFPGSSLHELSTTKITRVGQDTQGYYEYYYFETDEDFIPTMQMSLVAGRNFEKSSRNFDQIIVNEEAVQKLGFASAEAALGGKTTFRTRNDAPYSVIIGVVRNFHQRSPKEKHIPMLFYFDERTDYLSIRMNSQHVDETISSVKVAWDKTFPGTMFHYFFLDETYNNQYQSEAKFTRIISVFSGLAVFIACLGLFGLSSYTIVQRSKEIGIRKVLGASVSQIVRLLSKDFAGVILIASLLAMPIAYFAIEEWLSTYAVRITLNPWLFILPVVLIFAMALLTVSFQTIKTAIANPTNSLKQE